MVTNVRSELAFILSQLKAHAAEGRQVSNDENDRDDYLDEYDDLNSWDIDDDDVSALDAAGPGVGRPQDDILVGSSGGDLVFGFAGTDFIVAGAGADFALAGAGNDFIDGGAGWDVLLVDDDDDDMFGGGDDNGVNVADGGQGEDVPIFGSATTVHRDTIRGFQAGDKSERSGIDADAGTVGNDKFTLEAGHATTASGQIVVTHEREDGEYTAISGDTAGGVAPELGISRPQDRIPDRHQ
jgi:Ca2+-binding RTX toxin-like protein